MFFAVQAENSLLRHWTCASAYYPLDIYRYLPFPQFPHPAEPTGFPLNCKMYAQFPLRRFGKEISPAFTGIQSSLRCSVPHPSRTRKTLPAGNGCENGCCKRQAVHCLYSHKVSCCLPLAPGNGVQRPILSLHTASCGKLSI